MNGCDAGDSGVGLGALVVGAHGAALQVGSHRQTLQGGAGVMVRVSIVIPAYNRAHCIARALRSVRAQWETGDFELLLGDDASTDKTWEVVCGGSFPRPSWRAWR
jgi:hypothetical protein